MAKKEKKKKDVLLVATDFTSYSEAALIFAGDLADKLEGVGGTWIDGFFVRGPFDFAFVCDMPNEEAVAAMHAIVYSSGVVESVSIHTEIDADKVAATAKAAMGTCRPPS